MLKITPRTKRKAFKPSPCSIDVEIQFELHFHISKSNIEISKCLHVPFAGLYMNSSDLPLEQIRKYGIKNFRSIVCDAECDNSAVNIAIADLLQARNLLLNTNDEMGVSINHLRVQFSPANNDPVSWAIEIREKFRIDLQEQFRTSSKRKLYLYIRSAIEAAGYFVHCFSDVDVGAARGISIFDEQMSIIGLNSDDRPPAKSFSIIHELVHLLKRESTMCNEMFSSFSSRPEEVFCNAVAGECLVPKDALTSIMKQRKMSGNVSLEDIAGLADVFSVSREVIIRRLYDSQVIVKERFDAFSLEIENQYRQERADYKEAAQQAKETGKKTTFSQKPELVAIDRTSSSMCRALYNGYCEEIFSKQDVARYLNISQKHVEKFLREVSSWH